MRLFSADELAAMRRVDAWIDRTFRITNEERAAAAERDRDALRDTWDAEHRRARDKQNAHRAANRDTYNAKARAHYAANRERLAAYQRAYRAKRRQEREQDAALS